MSHTPKKGSPLAQSRVEAARNGPRVPVFAIAVGALVVVLLAAIVAVVAFGGDDDGGSGGETASDVLPGGDQAYGEVTVEGESLPTYSGGEDPAVGQPAPTLEGESPSGDPVTIDPSDGPMVVFFLAHWCPHCQAEVPRIVELADGSDEVDGVPFAAVLTSTDPTRGNFPPGDWLAEEGWPAPALLDTEPGGGTVGPEAFMAYGVAGYPFAVAIDGDGNVVTRTSGELGDDGLSDLFAAAAE